MGHFPDIDSITMFADYRYLFFISIFTLVIITAGTKTCLHSSIIIFLSCKERKKRGWDYNTGDKQCTEVEFSYLHFVKNFSICLSEILVLTESKSALFVEIGSQDGVYSNVLMVIAWA